MPLPPSPPESGFPWSVVLPYLWAVVASVLTWFAAQFTKVARLEGTILAASQTFVEQAQKLRAQDIARISELEGLLRHAREETSRQEDFAAELREQCLREAGEIRSLKQTRDSLIALVKRAGIDVPGE